MLCTSMSSLMFIRLQVTNNMKIRNGTVTIMARFLFAGKQITQFETWIIGKHVVDLEIFDSCLAEIHLPEAEGCERMKSKLCTWIFTFVIEVAQKFHAILSLKRPFLSAWNTRREIMTAYSALGDLSSVSSSLILYLTFSALSQSRLPAPMIPRCAQCSPTSVGMHPSRFCQSLSTVLAACGSLS